MNPSVKGFLQACRIHVCQLRKIQMPVALFCNRRNKRKCVMTQKHFQINLSNHGLPRKSSDARFFSCKDILRIENDQWKISATRYIEEAAQFRQRLESINERYSGALKASMVRVGDFAYFEVDGSVYRSRLSDGHVENVLCLQELGYPAGHIQRIRISPDQQRLAASVTTPDSDHATCIIVNFQKLQLMEHVIPNVFSFEWATKDVLFYTEQKNVRCSRVFLCDIGDGKCTRIVYSEENPRFFVDICCTQDKRFLTINCNSKNTSEVWLVDCDHHPFDPPRLVQKRIAGVLYHIEHRDDMLYVLTTLGENGEYKLMKAPVSSCTLENWQLIYKVKEKTKLVDLEMAKDHCVMFLKHCNFLHLMVISLCTETVVLSKQLPAWACAFDSNSLCDSSSSRSSLGFQLSSPVQPPLRFVYSLVENCVLAEEERQDVQDGRGVCTVRLEAESKDGTMVPITVFHKPSEEIAKKPMLVHVYGAYGIDLNMNFKSEKLLLIEDGWILAYCHVRGGGELGHRWHEEGRLENKLNGLEDLRASIVHLQRKGYSEPSLTALTASSAGGVLAGSLCNNYPDLTRAVILQAPFLDVLNTMLNESLPLTIEEQEEWGNPVSNEKHMEYIKSYCPHQNIKPQNYPSILIHANEDDQRIALRGLLGYVGRLRKVVADHSRSSNTEGHQTTNIILHIEPGEIHCNSSSWDDSLNEVAEQYAFLYTELGLEVGETAK